MQSTKQVVVFKLGDMQYGFPIENVNEIIRYTTPTKIPNAHGYIGGVISLRGKVYAIISLRDFFGIDKRKLTKTQKLLLPMMAMWVS